ncbi:hypothetical protein [Psychromicrobium sp. YIM B11713]|uniref:hypothetical protein n=1 Tax=Psychromicrobium sp. YIM B11713 TaxID=3145233 RepID=UPI00374FC7C4
MAHQGPNPVGYQDAYQRGYLEGHRAGWDQAMRTAGLPPSSSSSAQQMPVQRQTQVQYPQAPQPPVQQPATQQYPSLQQPPFPQAVNQQTPAQQPLAQYLPARTLGAQQPFYSAAPVGQPLAQPRIPAASGQHLAPQFAMPQPLDQEQLARLAAERKAKRERVNINVTLYAASLLILGSAALGLSLDIPPVFRLVGLWVVTALFYLAGLVLHTKTPRLRPAALAFTGTGLALVPVAGVASYLLAIPNAALCWLLTSLTGTIAYLFAALRLNSKVVAWLSLSFLISSSWAGLALVGSALIWYFVAMMLLAALLTALRKLRPNWVLPLYLRPLHQLESFLVPGIMVVSVLFLAGLNATEHTLVLACASLYYLVLLLVSGTERRWSSYLGLRAALTLTAAYGAWWLSGHLEQFLAALVLLTSIQLVLDSFAAERVRAWLGGSIGRTVGGLDRLDAVFYATFGLGQLAALLWSGSLMITERGADRLLPSLLALLTSCIFALGRRRADFWLPLVPVVLALLLFPWLGAWRAEVLLTVSLAYTVYRWLGGYRRNREQDQATYLLSSRILLIVMVPVGAMALLELPALQGVKDAWLLIPLLLTFMLCLQLLLEGLLIFIGRPGRGAEPLTWCWAALAFLTTFGLSLRDNSSPTDFSLSAVWLSSAMLGIAAVVSALLSRRRWQHSRSLEFLAPAVLAALALLRCSHGIELAAFSAVLGGYALLLRIGDQRQRFRAGYLLLSRVALSIAVLAAGWDLSRNREFLWLLLTAVLLGQLLLSWLFRSEPWQQATASLILALMLLNPLCYAAGTLLAGESIERWVLLIAIFGLAAGAAVAQWPLKLDGAVYLVAVAVAGLVFFAGAGLSLRGGSFLAEPILSKDAQGLSYALLALLAILLSWGLRVSLSGALRWAWPASAGLFLSIGFALSGNYQSSWVLTGLVAVATVSCFTFSAVQNQAWAFAGGAVTVVLLSVRLATELNQVFELAVAWRALIALWLSLLVLYGLRLIVRGRLDPVRRWSVLSVLGIFALIALSVAFSFDGTALAAALSLLCCLGLGCRETAPKWRPVAIQISVPIASLGLLRGIFASVEVPGPFWILLWWAVTAALVAGYHQLAKTWNQGQWWFGTAAGFLSLAALSTTASGDVGQQIAALIGFAVLLAAGLVLSQRLGTIWGAVGILAATLWWLRGLTFLLLATIAVVLIALVIWRLLRSAPRAGDRLEAEQTENSTN